MKKYQDWAQKEYSLRQRVVVLALAGVLFLGIIPYYLYKFSTRIDATLHLPKFYLGILNPIAGAIFIAIGLAFAWWSIGAQIELGRGTPVPVMPTQKLVVQPPFTYCRNPMTLGTIVGYAGIGVWLGSYSAVGIVLLFGLLLVLYIKLLEEKELEARFGEAYLEYKRQTPFMIPRFHRRD